MKKLFCFLATVAVIFVIIPINQAFADTTTINGTNYTEIRTVVPFYDFSDEKLPSPLNTSVMVQYVNLGGGHGNVLRLYNEDGGNTSCRLLGGGVNNGIVVAQYDVMFNVIKRRDQIFQFATLNSEGVRGWNNSLYQFSMSGTTGKIVFKDSVGISRDIGETLIADEWYRWKLMFDVDRKTFSFIVDDEVLLWDEPMADQTFRAIDTIQIRDYGSTASVASITYIDNLTVSVIAREYFVESVGGSDDAGGLTPEVDYENGIIAVKFSEPMDTNTLDNIILYGYLGDIIPCLNSYDEDTNVFYMTAQSALFPNMEYSIVIGSDVKTIAGAARKDDLKVNFKTKKMPFGIENITLDQPVAPNINITITTAIRNESEVTGNGALIAAMYCKGSLRSVFSADVFGAGNYDLILKVPDENIGDCTITVYLLKNLSERHIIDILSYEINKE
jgi:hypothetical protein